MQGTNPKISLDLVQGQDPEAKINKPKGEPVYFRQDEIRQKIYLDIPTKERQRNNFPF